MSEKRLDRRRRRVHNRAQATYYLGELRRELNRREERTEHKRHRHQWALPAASTQLAQLRRLGVDFAEPLTRRQAQA